MSQKTRFDDLVPFGTVVVEASAAMWAQDLWEEERQWVQQCTPSRLREFTAGRNCIRQALQRLNHPEVAIPVGEGGEPVFPAGLVGSLTHAGGYCAATVQRMSDGNVVGIDAEILGPLDPSAMPLFMGPKELDRLAELTQQSHAPSWAHVILSAKESFYKALYRRWPAALNFHDMEVTLEPYAGTYKLTLLSKKLCVRAGGCEFMGRFKFSDNLVLTAITVGL